MGPALQTDRRSLEHFHKACCVPGFTAWASVVFMAKMRGLWVGSGRMRETFQSALF